MTIEQIVAQFNVVANTQFNRTYKEFDPMFGAMIFEYTMGLGESSDFPFFGFLNGLEEFTGQRKHQTFPEGFKFTITNVEWDMAVDIPIKTLQRAAAAASKQLKGLDIYRIRIGEMAKQAKDYALERAYDMMIAGTSNTYGLCFDGQTLYATTHDMAAEAGTQSNLLTGTGTTLASVKADLLAVKKAFGSFYYVQGDENSGFAQRRKLNNSRKSKIKVYAPVELEEVFFQLITKNQISDTLGDNEVKNMFEYETLHMADAADWYAVLDDESMFKPFIHQIELPVSLDLPSASDESIRELKKATYGAYGRSQIANGAWFKTVKVNNP